MLTILARQAELTAPVLDTVERARTRLIVALMELTDDPSYGDVHSDAAVVLDRLADLLEDPAVTLGW